MTPQQRCRAALAHAPVDRLPTYLPAIACSVASQLLGRPVNSGTGSLHYAEVKAWSEGDSAHADFEARLLQDLFELHKLLEIDVFRMPWRMNRRPQERLDESTFLFGDRSNGYSIWRYVPGSGDFGIIERSANPLSPEETLREQVQQLDAAGTKRPEGTARAIGRHQGVVDRFGNDFFAIMTGGDISAGQEEEELIGLALEPELTARKLMHQAEDAAALGRALVEAGLPAVLAAGGDMAGNTGPLYSPDSFREVTLPALKHAISSLGRAGCHYMFRSDGNLWPVADMLFGEAACPGYGEADRDATMSVAALRQRFPNLVIWGNFPSSLLARASVGEVRDEAAKLRDESGGRGYFQGCSNAIIQGTPPENVLAMFSVR